MTDLGNKERLRELITVLQSLKPEQLDLTAWAYMDKGDPAGHHTLAGCGLKLTGSVPQLDLDTCIDLGLLPDITFEGLKGPLAVIKFYGLNQRAYNWIFDLDFYDGPPEPEDVIDRIKFYIENPNRDWWSCVTIGD